ncbi:suppressor APC domain-containing protein 2-like [Paramormyrops kingsleyae]|uniref:suppressor APC domain-containing protein 2-like n=1 Tax=Paramormyrops kingsleyae TaxID=1676925 RepID=UPI003B971BB0
MACLTGCLLAMSILCVSVSVSLSLSLSLPPVILPALRSSSGACLVFSSHMAFPGSYTVAIIPQQSAFQHLDSLHFFLWLKRLKELEREKDCLWAGLETLEQARMWYHQQLEENRERHDGPEPWTEYLETPSRDCLIRSRIQRVNGRLGNLMFDPNTARILPCLEEGENSDSSLQWQNTVLIQEVSRKSQKISTLERERDGLLEKLQELHRV